MKNVSIIVPVYNVEDYLKKCLDSLVSQTLKDIEIIIVNDGSKDNSQIVIDEYLQKYPHLIKSFKKKNGGLSDARNFGLKHASGEYIAFVDSDDYVSPNMMKLMYDKATKEDLDIVVCDSIEVYKDKEILKKSNLKYSDDNIKNYIIAPPMACTRLYKRFIFDKIKFTKNIYYEDLFLNPSLVKITPKIGFLELGLYYYVQRDNSIMKQKEYNERLLDIFKVLDYNKTMLIDLYPDEVEFLYISHLLRSASLRFINYKEAKELINKVILEIKKIKNYKNNKYYKKTSYKFKIICFLAYHKKLLLLKLIKKLGGLS